MLSKFLHHCEDSLTASVFSHLLYLPHEVFWKILQGAFYSNELPELPGEPIDIQYWPSWNSLYTSNTRRVEPDLFIRFNEFDLIIEAKRWDDGQQYRGQWENEVQAYLNEYSEEAKPLYFIALGGLHSEVSETIEFSGLGRLTNMKSDYRAYSCPVIKARWAPLLKNIRKYQRELSSCSLLSSQSNAHIRICESVIQLLSSHGFSTGKWIDEFNFSPNLGRTDHIIPIFKTPY